MRFQCRHCHCILDIDHCEPGELVVCGSCGREVEYPSSPVSPTAMLGDFAIVRELGQGGMGMVYLARQVSLDRNVALKILSSKYAEDATFIRNFINEARVAASLNHPNIIQAYAVSMENGLYYFAMEYVEGRTMKDLLQEKQKLPPQQVLQIALDVVSALDYAWQESRLLHRDIKPDNIMITQDGRCKLADLGLAGRQEDILEGDEQELYGTPQYIAPELLLKHPHDQRSDMYSLGATLYQALTGRYPYEADTVENLIMEHGRTPLRPVDAEDREQIPGLAFVIEKLLAKRPAHRYQTFAELKTELVAVRDGGELKGRMHPASQIPMDYNADDPLALPEGWEKTAGISMAQPDGRLFHDDGSVEQEDRSSGGHGFRILAVLVVLGGLAAGGWYLLQGKKSSAVSEQPAAAVSAPDSSESEEKTLDLLKKRIAEEGFSVGVRQKMESLGTSMSSRSPEYGEFMQLVSPCLEEMIAEAREKKIQLQKKQWLAQIEKYRRLAEQQKKAAAAQAEKKRKAAEIAAEKKKAAAEVARRAAEIRANKQKTLEDMVYYTRDFDFDSAVRGFKMLDVGLEAGDRGWGREWVKCLEQAARAYALIHDSERKYSGIKLTVRRREWVVQEIQFDKLTLLPLRSGEKKGGEETEMVRELGLLGNSTLGALLYEVMKKEGLSGKADEYFGCLLWCRGGAEVYAGKMLAKTGGYKRMLAEEKMMRQAYVRGWLRLLQKDKYSAAQARLIYGDLKRRYEKETAAVDEQLRKIINAKK